MEIIFEPHDFFPEDVADHMGDIKLEYDVAWTWDRDVRKVDLVDITMFGEPVEDGVANVIKERLKVDRKMDRRIWEEIQYQVACIPS